MAVLFDKKVSGHHYQVRNAGQSIRLYSNGVLHSQYNPRQPINGAIWDLLLLPGFLLSTPPKSILLLGLGGGTLVHLIRLFFPTAHMTCIELDKQHISIAKKWFKLPKKNVTLIEGDAYEYMQNTKETFDWIVDDVFQHINGEPERGTDITSLLGLYKQSLKENSLLTLNVIGADQKREFNSIKGEFSDAYELRHPLYSNQILSVVKGDQQRVNKAMFAERLANFKILDQSYKSCKLNFEFKKLP